MAIFGNQGRPYNGGQAGPSSEEKAESGEAKAGLPPHHEPPQVSSPKFHPGMPVKPQTGAFRPEPPTNNRAESLKPAESENADPAPEPAPAAPQKVRDITARETEDAKNLIVGRGIKLNGQISACDRLVVEGTVEADLNDAEAIEVTTSGLFKGTASIQEADISGRFEGSLVVKRRLILRNGGRIEGSVKYAVVVIEEGGQIRGQMDAIGADGEPRA